MDDIQITGNWIRSERKRLGLTQEQLGKKAGISALAISLFETGKTKNPHKETRERLLGVLGYFLTPEERLIKQAQLIAADLDQRLSFDLWKPETIPATAGVYVFRLDSGACIYVGHSSDMRAKVRSHLANSWFRGYAQLFHPVSFFIAARDLELCVPIEAELKKLLAPKLTEI